MERFATHKNFSTKSWHVSRHSQVRWKMASPFLMREPIWWMNSHRAASATTIIAHRRLDLTTAKRSARARYRMTDRRPSLFDPRLDDLAQNVQQKLVCLLNPRSGIAPHQEINIGHADS